MHRRLFAIALTALLAGHHVVFADARDLTDRARIKVVAGNWVTDFGAIRLTEDVAFTKESSEFLLTFFKVNGLPATYSVIDNNIHQPVLLLKFDEEAEIRTLGLEIRNSDLLVITTGKDEVFEWHRGPENFDLTEDATLQRLSGTWAVLEIAEGFPNLVEFTTDPDGEFTLPNSSYKARLYRLRSRELGDQLPIKSYSVIRIPGHERSLVLSLAGDDKRYLGEFRLEADAMFVGNQIFATRSAPVMAKEPVKEKGSLSVRVAHGEVLGLTAAEFTVRLKGDQSTNFLNLEDSSGGSLMQSGYAYFGLLPKGKYKLSVTGHFKRGDERVPFTMDLDYVFSGGTVVCQANVSSGIFDCAN